MLCAEEVNIKYFLHNVSNKIGLSGSVEMNIHTFSFQISRTSNLLLDVSSQQPLHSYQLVFQFHNLLPCGHGISKTDHGLIQGDQRKLLCLDYTYSCYV